MASLSEETPNIRYIAISDIIDWSFNPRNLKSPETQKYLDELEDSIRNHGLIYPIIVRPHPKIEGKYQGIDGQCRYTVLSRMMGRWITARIANIDDSKAYEMAIKLNLNPTPESGASRALRGLPISDMEVATKIKEWIEKTNITQTEVAKRLGCSQSWISKVLSILDESRTVPEVKEAVAAGVIPVVKAVEIAKASKEVQPELLKKASSGQLSFTQLREARKTLKEDEEEPEIDLTPIPSREVYRCAKCGATFTIYWYDAKVVGAEAVN